MNRFCLRMMLCAVLMAALSAGALAQDVMRVYVSTEAIERKTARQLTQLLGREFPQAQWMLEDTQGGDLQALVLSDHAPHLAICMPSEALPWAREGLMQPLQKHVKDQTRLAKPLLAACVNEEDLFMAPLLARHRQMAVNVKRFEKQGMGYMLDKETHPVWYPTEFQQILEEFAIAQQSALDLWRPQMQDMQAIEALIQSIYDGCLLNGEDAACGVGSPAIRAGVRWLRDLKESEMVGYLNTRQEALERFIEGETAMFLDWTESLQKQYAEKIKESGMRIETRPYPGICGIPVRSYEVVGVSALTSGDAQTDMLAAQAAAFLHESIQVQVILGSRAIYEDDSIWLPVLDADERGATLRSLLCDALCGILEEGEGIDEALSLVQAGMDTVR